VTKSVNGNFASAGDAVRALLEADPKGDQLTNEQLKRIVAAYKLTPETDANTIEKYGLVDLNTSLNQLLGDNFGHRQAFIQRYAARLIAMVDLIDLIRIR